MAHYRENGNENRMSARGRELYRYSRREELANAIYGDQLDKLVYTQARLENLRAKKCGEQIPAWMADHHVNYLERVKAKWRAL